MSPLRWIAGVVVFLALVVVSLQNAEPVTLHFYHELAWQTPLIFLLLVVFAVGVAAGLLAGLRRSMRLKRQITRMRREQSKRASDPAQPR